MWDKVKGVLFEGEEAPKAAPTAQQQAPAAVGKGSTVSYTPQASLNEAMIGAIRKATMSRNTALTALIAASDALTDIIPDPVMRLKAAHKTAGAGRSAKEITDAVAIHLNDVDAEEMRFAQALTGKVNAEVGGLQRQAEAAEAAVNAATNEIQSLTQRITQLQQQIGEQSGRAQAMRSEAALKENELRQSESEFKAAAQYVRNELNGHKNTILSTLG